MKDKTISNSGIRYGLNDSNEKKVGYSSSFEGYRKHKGNAWNLSCIYAFVEMKWSYEKHLLWIGIYILLVFVLAAFCWTKSLLCNVAAFIGMPYISKSSDIQSFFF
jgi:hypothetical protein